MKDDICNDNVVLVDLDNKKDLNDLYGMCYDILGDINIKSIFFLYLIFVLLSSNIFTKYILEQQNINDTNNIDSLILLRGFYLVLIFMLIQILIKINIL
jgi:hypothetical protein